MSDSFVRVLLAEDSPTARQHLTQIINEMPGLKVIGEARDGAEALELVPRLKPDVISMDIRMPGIDGLEATRRIMAQCPTPIVVVSGLLEEEIDLSFQALQAGALAVVPKPPSRDKPSFSFQQRQLVNTLTAMAAVRVIRRWDRSPGLNGSIPYFESNQAISLSDNRQTPEILAIGASAGGPGALNSFFSHLPVTLPIPVVVVQHMPDEFLPGLSRWLGDSTALPVRVGAENVVLKPGTIYISPGNVHLTVARVGESLVTKFVRESGAYRYQPSVDVLFHSVAKVCGSKGIGLILTGMGDDGADGMLAIRNAGGRTFAQDRDSSTVFGMPAAAVEHGGVEEVLPLTKLPGAILKLL
jgi:two-component system chemotaxis response regulator CheB